VRIAHIDYNFIYELSENDRGILIIEDARTFRMIINQLKRSLVDREEIFIFSDNNKIVRAWEKIDLVTNPIDIVINSRKLVNKLYDKINEEINMSDLLIDNNLVCQNIEKLFLRMSDVFELELSYKEKIEANDILKMLDIKVTEEYSDETEKVVEYMHANRLLLGIEYFIFVNLNTFFNSYEIEKIYEFAEYNKINIFLVESIQPDSIEKYTQVKIIDKDNCEISLDM